MSECKHEWEWGERELTCELCEKNAKDIEIAKLEAALQSIKDDYEFCQTAYAQDRAHAYYETACKALTKEES